MAKSFFTKTDRAVDRIGYWYGFYQIIKDHWALLSGAVIVYGASAAAFVHATWRYVTMTAANVSVWIYAVFFIFLALAFVGFIAAILLALRWRYEKTWLGYDRSPTTLSGRTDLADRANLIARKVSALYGQWEADHAVAWKEDAEKMSEAVGAGRHPFSLNNATNNVDRKYIERYSDQCLSDVWSVISLSRKYIIVDRTQLWHVSHGIRSTHDLYSTVQFLSSIEASLRNEQPDLPLFDQLATPAQSEPQSPQGR